MSTPADEEKDAGQDPELSSDATWATYEEAPQSKEAEYPPPGPSVIQTPGKPQETPPAQTAAQEAAQPSAPKASKKSGST